jgi:GTP pyrophosphokinase
VASLVLDSGGDEDEAIAALLHDAPEDQGGVARLEDITQRFGLRVGAIVKACSDSLVADPSQKSPWRQRKEIYIDQLRHETDPSVHLISVADKLHNARSIMLERSRLGDAIWVSFKGGKAGTLWSYRALIEAYRNGPPDNRRRYLEAQLEETVDALERVAE